MEILIDFNALVNTDYASCRLIETKYPKLYNKIPYSDSSIINRYNPNPLESISIDDSKIDIDNLYNQLLDKHYEEILSNSYINNLILYIYTLKEFEDANIHIRCKNQIEYVYAKNQKEFESFEIFISNEKLSDNYDGYILKVIKYCDISHILNKKIYFPNYKFNEIFLNLGEACQKNMENISILNIYNKCELKG